MVTKKEPWKRKRPEEVYRIIYERMLQYRYLDVNIPQEDIDWNDKQKSRIDKDPRWGGGPNTISEREESEFKPKDLDTVFRMWRGSKQWSAHFVPLKRTTTPLFDENYKEVSIKSGATTADEFLERICNNGWVTHGHIERPESPYPTPEKKRYEFLNASPWIEKAKLTVITHSGEKTRKTLTLYRLRRDNEAMRYFSNCFISEHVEKNYFWDLLNISALQILYDLETLQMLMMEHAVNALSPEYHRRALAILEKMTITLKKRELTQSKQAPTANGLYGEKPLLKTTQEQHLGVEWA